MLLINSWNSSVTCLSHQCLNLRLDFDVCEVHACEITLGQARKLGVAHSLMYCRYKWETTHKRVDGSYFEADEHAARHVVMSTLVQKAGMDLFFLHSAEITGTKKYMNIYGEGLWEASRGMKGELAEDKSATWMVWPSIHSMPIRNYFTPQNQKGYWHWITKKVKKAHGQTK